MAAPQKTKKPADLSQSILKRFIIPLTTLGIISLLIVTTIFRSKNTPTPNTSSSPTEELESVSNLLDLPHPNLDSRTSIEKAISSRRSYRSFEDKSISLGYLSQLLWSAQGVTTDWGGRTVSSSKSAYPLSLYIISSQINDLDKGLYLYIPGDIQPAHQLSTIYKSDLISLLAETTDQYSIQHAPLVIIVTSSSNKIEAYLEAGQVAQNLFLQSESLGLGMATISSQDSDLLKEALKLPEEETIILFIPVGHPKK
jgi:SagB-type dehydrogenase family enzyme